MLLRFGRFELDQRLQELRREGVLVRLQLKPFKLLVLLARRSGDLVTREEIRRALWDEDTFVDFEQGVAFCVRQLRIALGDDARAPVYVQTLPRRGYRFIAPVLEIERPPELPQAASRAGASPARRRPPVPLLVVLALLSLFLLASSRRLPVAPAEMPADPEVRRLTLAGRHLFGRCRPDQLRRALELFEEAVRRNPGYAPAWVGVADTYTTLGDYASIPPDDAFRRATRAALRALALDPSLAAAHVTLARLRAIRDWDWGRARGL